MIIDSAFKIGATHSVCQDYAYHNDTYAIIADGCSSSKDTDIGARITVRALEKVLNKYSASDYANIFDLCAVKMDSMRTVFELSQACLDVTLGFIYGYTGVLYGDGAFIVKYEDGHTLLTEIEFTESYPLYLSYSLNSARKAEFLAVANNKKVIKKTLYDADFNLVYAVSDIVDNTFVVEDFTKSELNCKPVLACVTSDGINSFQSKVQGKGFVALDKAVILSELTNIKVNSAGFMQRRLDRYSETMLKRGIRHYDDFSIGAILYATN